MNAAIRSFIRQRLGVTATLLVIVIALSIASPFFLVPSNIVNIVNHMTITLILSLGMVFVLASGGVDLSVGSTLGLGGVIVAILLKANLPIVLAVAAGLLLGAVVGIINGVFITRFNVQPFVMTLAMLSIVRGLALVFSQGKAIYNFPTAFNFAFGGTLLIPMNIYLAAVLTAVGAIVANRTKFGLYARSIGGSEASSRICGVNVFLVKTSIYAVQGLLAVLASFIFMSLMDAAEPLAGLQTEWMEAIAAPIIGGNSFSGGVLTIYGTVIGAFILSAVRNGLNILGVQPFFQQLFIGLIVIISVIADSLRQKRALR
jgi:ribose transport system permease protein